MFRSAVWLLLIGCGSEQTTPVGDWAGWEDWAQPEVPGPAAPPLLALAVDGAALPGATVRLIVSGATSGETVGLARSPAAGPGPCPALLGGLCLDITAPIEDVQVGLANADGIAVFSLAVPAGTPAGATRYLQAAVARGPGSLTSNVATASVPSPPPEVCGNGVDDDLDGTIDCEDADCVGAAGCSELCSDGLDNDGDGLLDCDDDECWGLGCHPEGVRAQVNTGQVTYERDYGAGRGGYCGFFYDWDQSHTTITGRALGVVGTVAVLPPGGAWGGGSTTTCSWGVATASFGDRYRYVDSTTAFTSHTVTPVTRAGVWVAPGCRLAGSAFLPDELWLRGAAFEDSDSVPWYVRGGSPVLMGSTAGMSTNASCGTNTYYHRNYWSTQTWLWDPLTTGSIRPSPVDGDGDGFHAGLDCDDTRSNVFPGAVERCTGRDDDCDGYVDDADPSVEVLTGQLLYADADLDGAGDPDTPVWACAPAAGRVTNAADCNDGDDRVVWPLDWLADGDGDGVGAGVSLGYGCSAPTGVEAPSTAGVDCDDSDPARFPGQPDTCGDGVDADCSGGDACAPRMLGLQPLSTAAAAYTQPPSSALQGRMSAVAAGDVNGDGIDDLLVGNGDGADGPADGRGRAWLMLGPVSGTGTLDLSDLTVSTPDDQQLGFGVDVADLDGDGLGELVLGGPTGPAGGWAPTGVARVYDVVGATPQVVESATLLGNGGSFGAVVRGVELTGDAFVDVAVLASTDSDPGTGQLGAVYIFPGPLSGPVPYSSGIRIAAGGRPSATNTVPMATGDLDGDGVTDLAISGSDSCVADIRVLYGPLTVPRTEASSDADLQISTCGYVSVGMPEDVSGDGRTDLAISDSDDATGGVSAGAVRVWTTPPVGSMSLGGATLGVAGDPYTSMRSVGGPGDLDRDGFDDLALGAQRGSSTVANEGGVALMYGPIAPGAYAFGGADARVYGGVSGRQLGARFAGPADLDGDGYGELIVTSDERWDLGGVFTFRGGP